MNIARGAVSSQTSFTPNLRFLPIKNHLFFTLKIFNLHFEIFFYRFKTIKVVKTIFKQKKKLNCLVFDLWNLKN